MKVDRGGGCWWAVATERITVVIIDGWPIMDTSTKYWILDTAYCGYACNESCVVISHQASPGASTHLHQSVAVATAGEGVDGQQYWVRASAMVSVGSGNGVGGQW